MNFKKLTPPINISPRYVCTFWLLSTNFNVCIYAFCLYASKLLKYPAGLHEIFSFAAQEGGLCIERPSPLIPRRAHDSRDGINSA